MKITKIKLADINRPERNVRIHPEKQLVEMQRSIEAFGQIRPIVVDENYTIIAGNGLYETLLRMEYDTADCYIVTHLTEAQKKKLMLADNRIYTLGTDDLDAFDAIIRELGTDLDVPGYDEALLESLVADTAQIDDLLAEYGTISEETQKDIVAAGERYEARLKDAIAEHIDTADNEAHSPEKQKAHVVCPNCGETIWL